MDAPGGGAVLQICDFSQEKPSFESCALEEAKAALRDPARLVWVDIHDRHGDAERILNDLAAGWRDLEGLKPELAAKREEDPTRRPPKAKVFHRFVFGRAYMLLMQGSFPKETLVAQEIHLIVGETFAITIRYPSLGWVIRQMATPGEKMPKEVDAPDINVRELADAVVAFRERVPAADSDRVFGLEVASEILDQVTDSIFQAMDALRDSVDAVELTVLDKQRWLWERTQWTTLDARMVALRRMLSRARWAFMPADEVAEFRAGPFGELVKGDLGINFRLHDLEREATRAVHAADDVASQIEDAVRLRDSIKSDRLNNTMYILATVTTVLLVPALIAGIYGMNFANLPGFGADFGFWLVFAAMIVLGALVWLGIQAYLRFSESPPPGEEDKVSDEEEKLWVMPTKAGTPTSSTPPGPS